MSYRDEVDTAPQVHPLLRPGQTFNPGGFNLSEIVDDEPWMDDALCPQVDGDLFFPEKGGSTREAKKICGMCPVAAECLDYALAHGERFGIWGGVSERDRRRLALRRSA